MFEFVKTVCTFHYSGHGKCNAAQMDFFFSQVLESVIKYRWNALPVEQRDGIKNYISDVIVQVLIIFVLALDWCYSFHTGFLTD